MSSAESYDYVIVGAGSAGCVIARRLIDALDCTVLLLEAGGSADLPAVGATDVPSMTSLWSDPESSWLHQTVGQVALDGRTVAIPQGRMLGGSSSINAMMYVRGNRRDFDHWNHSGNEGWSYQEVLEYFKRSETFTGPGSDFRGGDGPLSVIPYGPPSTVSQAFVAGAAELGFEAGDGDYNGVQQENQPFYYQSTRTPANRRATTASSFLRPVLGRSRLTVRTGALATRIQIEHGRACGVEYLFDEGPYQARADSEVIISCGALASPQLLMLSGIGPQAHLWSRGVEAVLDLPGVGQNLQDHLLFGVAYQSLQELPFPELIAEAGLFTHSRPGLSEASPDLQFFFGPVQFVADEYKVDGPGYTFAPILCQPHSRGSVTLQTAAPNCRPVVDPHYLEAQADVDALVRGLELARELAHTKAFDPFRGRELAPGDAVVDRAELVGYVRRSASTVWHPVGTCRMGRDRDAVVTPELLVHGVADLRVADASVMPSITSGNTNAATIMIGEKAADLIIARQTAGRTATPLAAVGPWLTDRRDQAS